MSNYFSFFFAYFYALTWRTIQILGSFYNFSFIKSSDLDFESKMCLFFWVLVDILPLGSGFVDPHIFADTDPDFLRNQRIRILSNDLKDILVRSTDKCACMLRSCAEVWVISGIVRSYSQDRDLAIVLHLLPKHYTLYPS